MGSWTQRETNSGFVPTPNRDVLGAKGVSSTARSLALDVSVSSWYRLGPYEGLMQATADLLAWAQNKDIVWDKWDPGSRGEGWRARIEHYLTDPRDAAKFSKMANRVGVQAGR